VTDVIEVDVYLTLAIIAANAAGSVSYMFSLLRLSVCQLARPSSLSDLFCHITVMCANSSVIRLNSVFLLFFHLDFWSYRESLFLMKFMVYL